MLIKDNQLPGLYQRARVSGNVWVVKAKQRGINKPVTVTLGRTDVINARDARRLAKDKLAMLAEGINPNRAKQSQLQTDKALSISLEHAITDYLSLRALKPSTVKSYQQVMLRCFGDWYKLPIREITREDVLRRYQEIQTRISANKTLKPKANPKGLAEAQKAMRYLSAVMTSYEGDVVNGSSLLTNGNPVNVLREKRAKVTLKSRDSFLNKKQRSRLFHHLSIVSSPQYKGKLKSSQADFVALLLVTGLRISEARWLRWENINSITYTVKDTKNSKDHTLPITNVVQRIFERNRNDTQWVFPGRNGAASMDKVIERVSEESGVIFTAHDLRRTAATIASEYGFSRDQISLLLNHSKETVTDRYIQTTSEALLPILQRLEDEILGNYEVEETSSNDKQLGRIHK